MRRFDRGAINGRLDSLCSETAACVECSGSLKSAEDKGRAGDRHLLIENLDGNAIPSHVEAVPRK